MSFEALICKIEQWKIGGVKKLSNGSVLICHVPHVAPEAWFHEVYMPLSNEEISQLEKEIGNAFPDVFREFLLCSNGINLFSDNLRIFGLRTSFSREGDEAIQPYHMPTLNGQRPFLCPKTWIFIGSYRSDGSRVFFNTNESAENIKVYRCKKDSTKVVNEWKSFWDWLLSEVERISQLYDANGVRINKKKDG